MMLSQKTNEELVARLSALFRLGDDLNLSRDNVVALVQDMGLDKAERAMLILADGTADAMKARHKQTSLVAQMTKSRPVSQSLVDQLLKGGKSS